MQSSDATHGSAALTAGASRHLVDLRTGEAVELITHKAVEVIKKPRIAYKPVEVAELLGVGERYVWTLIESGELGSVKLAGRRMILDEDLQAFVEHLKGERDRARGAAS